MVKSVSFMYTNHRGEKSLRTIIPESLDFIYNSTYGYQPGWFISGADQDRQGARRSFALSHIVFKDFALGTFPRKHFCLLFKDN